MRHRHRRHCHYLLDPALWFLLRLLRPFSNFQLQLPALSIPSRPVLSCRPLRISSPTFLLTSLYLKISLSLNSPLTTYLQRANLLDRANPLLLRTAHPPTTQMSTRVTKTQPRKLVRTPNPDPRPTCLPRRKLGFSQWGAAPGKFSRDEDADDKRKKQPHFTRQTFPLTGTSGLNEWLAPRG